MRSRIPKEIRQELACAGGLGGLKRSLPSPKELVRAARLHGALSDPTRLKLLLALRERRLCVCVLKRLVSCPDTRLSYHLGVLKRARLVESERRGSFLHYSLTSEGRAAAQAFEER